MDVVEDVDLTRVCAGLNYFQDGEDPLIREDGEYPDWLPNILKLNKEFPTDSKQYRRHLNKIKARKNNFTSKQLKQ